MGAQQTLTDAMMAEQDQREKLDKKPGAAEVSEPQGPQTSPPTESAPAAATPQPAEANREQAPAPAEAGAEPSLEPSAEMKKALDEAVKSVETAEEKERKQAEEPPRQSEEELKLKLEILELRRRVRELEAEVEKKARELKQNYDQGMMIKNQFEAHKGRVQREKADWFNYGHEPLLKDLLSVLDNFDRAVAHARRPEDFDALKQGIEMIYRQLLKVLENYGVKQISAAGAKFDPLYHEALVQVANPDLPAGTVMEEHTKGYLMKDRLLRASRVTISARPEGAGADAGESSQAGAAAGEKAGIESETKSDKIINPESQEGKKS